MYTSPYTQSRARTSECIVQPAPCAIFSDFQCANTECCSPTVQSKKSRSIVAWLLMQGRRRCAIGVGVRVQVIYVRAAPSALCDVHDRHHMSPVWVWNIRGTASLAAGSMAGCATLASLVEDECDAGYALWWRSCVLKAVTCTVKQHPQE